MLLAACGFGGGPRPWEERSPPIQSYEMFTDDGDQQIARIIEPYVARARTALEGATPAERIRAIWGDDWGVNVWVEPQDCDDAGLRPEG